MGILNYLPEFKVVEINRSTALINGHVLSQFKAAAGLTTKTVGTVDFLENGLIVGLNADSEVENYVAATSAQPFLVYAEELNTFMDGLKHFATEEDEDGVIYPRALALYVGDAFTTNYYLGTEAAATHAKIASTGILTLQQTADADTRFAVEASTLPDGSKAFQFIYIGKVVA